jgi:hypothetical protein
MKYLKVAGVAWGLAYFVIGATFSFTLGSNCFWSGTAVYLALFLLPLPIAFVGVWFPKIAGTALIVCAAISITVSAVAVISSGSTTNLAGLCKFTMYHVPHVVFAVAYLRAGRASKDVDSGDERPSVRLA